MKIAIDIRSLMEGRHSGVEEYTTQIIRALLTVAPQHSFCLFYNAAKAVHLPPFDRRAEIIGLRYPNKVFNGVQWVLNWPAWDRLIAADIFFVPSFRLLPISSAGKVVTTVHDLSFERFPEFFSWQRRIWHHVMRPQQLMKRSNHVIAVSQATADDLATLYGIPRDKITVIYSGMAIPDVTSRNAISYVRERYHLPERFILYFGTLEPRKNIGSIIHAFSSLAASFPHDLVIAGAKGWLLTHIEAAAHASPYRSRIHFPGFIEEVDKMSVYAAADLFVYPSFYEGFGFPPLEALLAGTPVITSFNASLPEIVGPWATLVNPDDPGELAAILHELLAAPPVVRTWHQEAIRQRYQWQEAAARTMRVLEATVEA